MFTMEMEEHGLTLGLLTLGRTNPCNLIENWDISPNGRVYQQMNVFSNYSIITEYSMSAASFK